MYKCQLLVQVLEELKSLPREEIDAIDGLFENPELMSFVGDASPSDFPSFVP